MSVTIEFSHSFSQDVQAVIIPCFSGKDAVTFDGTADLQKPLEAILASQSSFKAKAGDVLGAYVDVQGAPLYVACVGVGDADSVDAEIVENAGGSAYAHIAGRNLETVSVLAPEGFDAASFAGGVLLRSYRFDRYKKSDDAVDVKLYVVSADADAQKHAYDAFALVADGVFLARDLVNEAPNALYPESYAQIIKDELKPLGVSVEIMDEKKLLKMGMGGIMAVGQGSARQPRMVVMQWKGANVAKDTKPVALVGKGVTFDTGGISIKPSAGMDEMKMDMGGSAAVVGAMKAIAGRKADAHVVGIVGLAENMPSANAYRPGDIITSYAGKTVEVLNTDAEGRLVLMDALTHVQKEFDPEIVIDLATLTGAMVVALGHEYCGTFTNEDKLWDQLSQSGKAGHEKLWRMPLDEVWSNEMVSHVADLRNIGKSRYAGASTAAEFLHHFIDEGRTWAHMDIAGTAWITSDRPVTPKNGVGFGVRTLDKLVQQYYEVS